MSQSVATPTQTVPLNLRLTTFAHALAFVAGFSLIFIIGWGGTVTLAGQFFGQYKDVIARAGGVVVIFFGLASGIFILIIAVRAAVGPGLSQLS
jgi:cytochrome c biogenesis protein CcdA